MGAALLDYAQLVEDTSSQWSTVQAHISTSGVAFDNHRAFKVAANGTRDVGSECAHVDAPCPVTTRMSYDKRRKSKTEGDLKDVAGAMTAVEVEATEGRRSLPLSPHDLHFQV